MPGHQSQQGSGMPLPASVRPAETDKAAGEDRVRWVTLLKYLAIGIVAMFLFLVLLDKVVMPWYVKLGAVETVPSVVGLRLEDARKRLEKLGFEVKKGEPRFDDRYPAGTVVMQLPYGGQQTKQGRRVYLTISRGSELIPMLELTGMPLREARINLMRNGFDIGEVTYDHNDTIMKDRVFSQSIPATVPTRPGTIVNVIISSGPTTRMTMMPNLLSLDIDVARQRLENAGLVLGVVRYKTDPSYVLNSVIEQAVAPYQQVAQGAAVDLTVSGTPDPESNAIGDEGASPVQVHPITPERLHPVAPKTPVRQPSPPPAGGKVVPKGPIVRPLGSQSGTKPASKPAGAKPTPNKSTPAQKAGTRPKPTSAKPSVTKPATKPAKPTGAKPTGTKPVSKPAPTRSGTQPK